MALLDEILAANAAVAEGSDVPIPALPEDFVLVVVTCSEIRSAPGGGDFASLFGLGNAQVFVVAVAGARVQSVEGDVGRSVVVALARGGGGEVCVVAHDGCPFLAADPESVQSMLAGATSSTLVAAESLCGESYVSGRKLAITSAERLRASPFLPRGTPVHALVLNTSTGRLSPEDVGYGKVGAPAALAGGGPLGTMPSLSPMLQPQGIGGIVGGAGPVTLLGPGPSPMLGAPAPAHWPPAAGPVAAIPGIAGGPPPDFLAAALQAMPAVPVPVPPPPAAAAPREPHLVETISFEREETPEPEPPPPPPRTPPPRTGAADDPFTRAERALERLRRERRRERDR